MGRPFHRPPPLAEGEEGEPREKGPPMSAERTMEEVLRVPEGATERPWFHDPDFRRDGASQVVLQNGHAICFMSTGRMNTEDGDPDADLITRAVNLYAALARVAVAAEAVSIHSDTDTRADLRAALKALREKAGGA